MIKNTSQDTGKCKTIINIDNQNVFTSAVYEWEHPNENELEFDVRTGSFFQKDLKGAIRNITITSNE